MRITEREAIVIKEAVLQRDPVARVYLFCSRTDDAKRGGDIDILVISTRLDLMDAVRIEVDIEEKLGEIDMDLIVKKDAEDTFVKLVLEEGAILL